MRSPRSGSRTESAPSPGGAGLGVAAALMVLGAGAELGGCVAAKPEAVWPRLEPQVSVRTFSPEGDATDGRGLAVRVWGPGGVVGAQDPVRREAEPADRSDAAGPEAQDPAPPPPRVPQGAQDPDAIAARRERDAKIRTDFGSAVIIAADGAVTKQYSLSGEAAEVFLNLLREPGVGAVSEEAYTGFELDKKSQSVLARMLGDHQVKITVFKDFEPISASDIKADVKGVVAPPPASVKNSLLLVTAQPVALAAFESALNLFFSSVPQIEIEVRVLEINQADGLSFGVSQVDDNATLKNQGSDRLIRDITSAFPLSPPSIAGSGTERGILTLGGVHDMWELNARIEALEINQLADVLSEPRLIVRNGGLASVSTITKVPYPKAKFTSSGSNVVSDIEFKDVGVTLNIRPVIAGTDTVILQIYANVSAVTGFTTAQPVPIPTISQREVVTQVHVASGQATTIGGLFSKSKFDQVNKIPLLGDIPVLGYLFRSTTTQEVSTSVEFVIIPTIRTGAERGEELDILTPIGG